MKIIIAVSLLFAAGGAAAAERHVPAGYATIQQAIDAAANGDTVIVAPGTYRERIDIGGKRITVRSSAGAAQTMIHAGGSGPVARTSQNATRETVLEGFTLTGGFDDFDAGGLQIIGGRPTIRNNVIAGNVGGMRGNGIYAEMSGALIVGNHIAHNYNAGLSSGGGGAGGIGISGSACATYPGAPDCLVEVYANLIEDNAVDMYLDGGGMTVQADHVRVVGNVIRNNRAYLEGGGISVYNAGQDVVIENNLITGNRTTAPDGKGGGIYMSVVSGGQSAIFVVNNTFVDNVAAQGSALYSGGFDVASRFINNLVVGVPGVSAVRCETFGDPFPPIVRSNNVVVSGATPYAGSCADAPGTLGNIGLAPTFVAAGDYRLASGSAGIDAGNNAFTSQANDLAGNPRIFDGDGQNGAAVDIGAYELGDKLFADGFQ
jgi:Right handed beta helix region